MLTCRQVDQGSPKIQPGHLLTETQKALEFIATLHKKPRQLGHFDSHVHIYISNKGIPADKVIRRPGAGRTPTAQSYAKIIINFFSRQLEALGLRMCAGAGWVWCSSFCTIIPCLHYNTPLTRASAINCRIAVSLT